MISSLITKYLNGEATEQEAAQVFQWIEASKKNEEHFVELKKSWAMSQFSDFDKKNAWYQLKKSINKNKPLKITRFLKYAALLILLVSISSLIWQSKKQDLPGKESIVLELEETHTKLDLVKNSTKLENQLANIISEQNENEIIYKNEFSSQPISYHTLNIPFGKIFKITLSDGSVVHLNAGSSLRYPKQFSSTENRKVYLQGEAFFNIQKDEKRPFIVEANNTEIKVLGTQFNVNTSKLNNDTSCVLVEGSVKLSNTLKSIILNPNEKATWNPSSNSFKVNIVNTNLYTSWVKGELIFENANFKDISNKLTQFYDVEIKNQSSILKTQKFSGIISLKNTNVENILDLLSMDTPFSYAMEKNTIIIKNNHP